MFIFSSMRIDELFFCLFSQQRLNDRLLWNSSNRSCGRSSSFNSKFNKTCFAVIQSWKLGKWNVKKRIRNKKKAIGRVPVLVLSRAMKRIAYAIDTTRQWIIANMLFYSLVFILCSLRFPLPPPHRSRIFFNCKRIKNYDKQQSKITTSRRLCACVRSCYFVDTFIWLIFIAFWWRKCSSYKFACAPIVFSIEKPLKTTTNRMDTQWETNYSV